MSRFENFTPPTLGSELSTSEITMVEELTALANSGTGEFIRKSAGSLVNATLSETIALSGLSDVSISSATQGDILYYNGSGWVNLPAGENGQLLKTQGNNANPFWDNVDSSTGTVTSVSVVTANGVSGSVATSTTTPAITLTLGAITPSSVTVSGLTASEIVATDASKVLQSLAVDTYPSLTELTYVKGVTSAIQTQIGLKANLASPTFSGTVTIPTPFTIGAVSMTATGTELNYVVGVTSALQTQIDGKSPTAGNASLITVGTITTGVWNGTDVPVSAGGTGLSTISALSIWLANALNTVTEVTPGAGNSIRINAGGTAWEAYTPGAGGGDMVLADIQTVTGAKTFGTIGGVVGKFILAGSTSGSTIVNAAAVAGTTTLTLPGATDTLVGKATTDTFTNKTFDADGAGNSITNIENADIKAAAAIAVNKLAALTASEIVGTDASGFLTSLAVATYPSLTELSYVKGVTSALQTQLGLKAPLDSPTFTTQITTPSIISAGALGITPASGSNLNVNLAGTGDLAVNTNQLYVDTSTGNVGIGTTVPGDKLHILTSDSSKGLKVESTNAGASGASIVLYQNSASPAANDIAGRLEWDGKRADGSQYWMAYIDGIWTDPATLVGTSRLAFHTRNGDTDNTAMTIDHSGNVGIGTTTPTAVLHLKAGTATASTAPLKFTSGVVNTTPEAGAIEWDGTDLFITV